MKTPNVDQTPHYQSAMVTDKDAVEQPVTRDEADMIRMGKTQQTGVSNYHVDTTFADEDDLAQFRSCVDAGLHHYHALFMGIGLSVRALSRSWFPVYSC